MTNQLERLRKRGPDAADAKDYLLGYMEGCAFRGRRDSSAAYHQGHRNGRETIRAQIEQLPVLREPLSNEELLTYLAPGYLPGSLRGGWMTQPTPEEAAARLPGHVPVCRESRGGPEEC